MYLTSVGLKLLLIFAVVCRIDCEQGQSDKNDEEDGKGSVIDHEEGVDGKADIPEWTDDQLREVHRDFDINGDKEVSQQELVGFVDKYRSRKVLADLGDMKEEFGAMDTSKDGLVSLEEHLNRAVPRKNSTRSDADRERLKADETEYFKAADVNGDGVLDKDELPALLAPETSEHMLKVTTKHAMRDTDTDKNGKISLEEFRGRLRTDSQDPDRDEEVFKRLDKNGDGTLDTEEMMPLQSGALEREDMVSSFIESVDKNDNNLLESPELVQGKKVIRDSEIQGYLIQWAKQRPIMGR